MVSASDLEIDNINQIYEKKFDVKIDQSVIYNDVYFGCLGIKCPAIVLTPVCEIVAKKVDFITIAQIVQARSVYEFFLSKNSLTQEQILGVDVVKEGTKTKLNEKFIDLYIGNRTYQYHFLPKKEKIIEHSFVCFEIVQTLSCAELQKQKKIAVLKSPWRESLPSRYASYSLRIGTPRYSKEFLERIIQDVTYWK